MSRVNGYNAYQNNYYDNSVRRKNQDKTSKTDTTGKTNGIGKTGSSTQLSDKAKSLLRN